MAVPISIQAQLDYLDKTYERWEELPDTHPEIAKLQKLWLILDGGEKPNMGLSASRGKNIPKAIIQCDILGNPLRRFDSVTKASEYMRCSINSISLVYNGKRKYFKGFIWRFEDESRI